MTTQKTTKSEENIFMNDLFKNSNDDTFLFLNKSFYTPTVFSLLGGTNDKH